MSFGTGPFGTEPLGSAPQDFEVARRLIATISIDGLPVTNGSAASSSPPPNVERLACYLLPKRRREEILGDLEEDYWTNFLPKFGPRQARRMYWSQFVRSVAAIAPGWVWAAAGAAVSWLWGNPGVAVPHTSGPGLRWR